MRVAIVSYGFPPLKHVSGTRASQMAAWIASLGVDVCVVTVDWRTECGSDDEIWKGVRVRRVDPRRWYPEFDPTVTVTQPETATRWPRALAARRTLDWGALEGWGRATFDALSDLHAEAPLDVVWAIHGDDGAHEAAHRFHRATGVPWVADFKDPWHIFHKVAAVPLQFVATAHRLRSAAMLTETCERQGTFDVIFRRPTETIWSGYDAELMDTAPPVRSAPELSLVYVGHFATGRHDAAHLGRVLGEWDARDRDRKWALHVYGGNYGFLEASFASSRAARRLRLHPYTTQERAYGLMKGADVLVLLPAWNGWRGGGSVGVKELEYMASGTPLLCLGHLMDEMKPVAARCGTVFDSGDVDEAAIAFLQRQYDAFTSGNASPRVVNAPAVRAYAWPEQAKRLAAVLERAVDGSKR